MTDKEMREKVMEDIVRFIGEASHDELQKIMVAHSDRMLELYDLGQL